MEQKPKRAIISGITGQDGSYLAEFLLSKGYEVHGIIRRASTFNTSRIDHFYQDPHIKDRRLFLHYGDLTDSTNLIRLIQEIQPDEIYNLAAQSHVQVSFETPEYTANADALGVLRILEAIRLLGLSNKTKFYQASSSELYGKVQEIPQSEKTPFYPRSPYGVAKLYAHWITTNYREAYNIFACNGLLFNHECLTAQTPIIIMNKGIIDIIPIEEVVPHREHPRHGIKYTTPLKDKELKVWNGDNWTTVKTMTATWNKANSKNDKKVISINCRGGYYEATKDHLSFLKGEKKIKTGNLKKGDSLELKSFPELTEKTKLTLEEAEFLGMIVADGYVSNNGHGRIINNNQKLRERAALLWETISGGYSIESSHPSGFVKGEKVKSQEFFGRPEYFRFIHNEIYTEKKYKRIPKRVLNGEKEIINAFLSGYNKCDGLKGGYQKTEFKSFTTNSSVLALGLWYLINQSLKLRITSHPEFRDNKLYYHLNINSNKDKNNKKGEHLKRSLEEVKNIKPIDYTGWLFDLETESQTFSAGVGLTFVHNSPRRGETFVTRKISRGIARILKGLNGKLYLGNLEAKRDWGLAQEYCEAMWLMLQQSTPEDFVIGTGESHSVKEFVQEAFSYIGLDYNKYLEIDPKYYRPSEVDFLAADATKAKYKLGWEPKIKFKELVRIMIDADMRKLGLTPPGEGDRIIREKFPNKWWKGD